MYTIKQAADLTGVPEASLRAWERRYGVAAPLRTEAEQTTVEALLSALAELSRTGKVEGEGAKELGLFGLEQIPMGWPRLLGIVLLALGAALSLKK